MTDLRKSDAQLDAEAHAAEVGLRWYIVDLRRALIAESPSRIHQEHTSKTPEDELDAKGWTAYPDEGGIGLPFSSQMHRFLRTNAGRSANHRWDLGPDPKVRPAMASIFEISEACHARHTSHLRPGFSRSLCAQMVYEVCYLGQEPDDVAWRMGFDLERAEKMLLWALRHAHSWREDIVARLSREPGTEAPLPERRPYRPAA